MYLSHDRPDIANACKEAARHMKEPMQVSMEMMKRIGRYLRGTPRVVRRFYQQQWCGKLLTQVDADHAGCVMTRKSTTCTVMMHGGHNLSLTSNIQSVQATSSGESEFYAITKGLSNSLGMRSLTLDFGLLVFKIVIETDSSAGKGIALRLGAGKLKHIETQYLWSQKVFYDKLAELKKIPRGDNAADIGTRHCTAKEIETGLKQMGWCELLGSSKLALKAVGQGSATSKEVSVVSKRELMNELD